jgi:hypothetical protein
MSIFNKKDYESGSGMQTAVFGPPIWHSLHMISFNYPVNPTEQDKKHYMNFLLSYEHVLPCIYCRVNFKSNLKKAGFSKKVMKNRNTFSRFVYKLHNCVNDMLNKKVQISYEEVRDRYEHFRSRCNEKENKKKILEEQKKTKKEKGCTDSLYGSKSKCVLRIVPRSSKKESFSMESKCKAKRGVKK